jgi:predicted NAD-dependent protein-ADP-ribosyltransferase YbiA (DUF1768 family)
MEITMKGLRIAAAPVLALAFLFLAFRPAVGEEKPYPPQWRTPVPESEGQWWEILPQEAGSGELILSKRNELGLFSNFAATPFYFHGRRYASVEGFWYMLAYPEGPEDPRALGRGIEWKYGRDEVAAMTAFEAKTAGELAEANMAAMNINWVSFEGRRMRYMSPRKEAHYELIRQVLWEKVRQNSSVRELLLSTGGLILLPDNYDSLRDLPAWRYFDIYSEIRAILREGGTQPPSSRYPPQWWTPLPEEGKPDWEILPQAAKPGEVILSKRHELGILSNFASTPFTLDGRRYGSVEGFWQMMLYPEDASDPRALYPGAEWKYSRAEVAAMTGFEAKAAGELAEATMARMGIDWVSYDGEGMPYRSPEPGRHHELILEAMKAKLAQNPAVAEILRSTGDLVLLPDHIQERDAPPEWLYNRIWMELRDGLPLTASPVPAPPR